MARVYVLAAAQNLQLLSWKASEGRVDISYCLWLLAIGILLCPVMWLGSPKDMKSLALLSACTVTAVSTCIWCCILLDDQTLAPTDDLLSYQPTLRNVLLAYGIMAFQFDIHPMLLTIQVDMKDSSQINKAILGGFIVTGVFFAVTTSLAAWRYGLRTYSNLLQGIPISIPLYIVFVLVTLQLCLSSAVGNSALFQHIEALLGIPRDFTIQRCIIRSSIVAIAVFLAEAVPRFDLVMGLLGSTLTGPLMFIFPPLFFIKLSKMTINQDGDEKCQNIQDGGDKRQNNQDGRTKYKKIKYGAVENSKRLLKDSEIIEENKLDRSVLPRCGKIDFVLSVLVMIVGVMATGTAMYTNWSDTITNALFSSPCLLNATAAERTFFN